MSRTQHEIDYNRLQAANYLETRNRIRDLERKLEDARHMLEVQGQILVGGMIQRGDQEISVGHNSIVLSRRVTLRMRDHAEFCEALRRAGLGDHVREDVVQVRTLTEQLDRMGLTPELAATCELVESRQLQVKDTR